MKFKLEFDMDNDAFDVDANYEFERIIKEHLLDGNVDVNIECEHIIRDINGNRIGKLEITE